MLINVGFSYFTSTFIFGIIVAKPELATNGRYKARAHKLVTAELG